MKVNDIRKLSDSEINTKVVELKKELFELRLIQATGSLDKPYRIHDLRKTIAKLLTIKKEREIRGGSNE
ncbi:MAG: 50S ribosomal protein L29 [Clostridiales bacterium]|nr:50S ribosomal protein L29 [Clostridiales bacterium]